VFEDFVSPLFILPGLLSMNMPMHTHAVHGLLIALPLSCPIPPFSLSSSLGQGGNDWTALISAVNGGYIDAVKSLVAADPDPAHLTLQVRVP
jgi:hypothetical protein